MLAPIVGMEIVVVILIAAIWLGMLALSILLLPAILVDLWRRR